MEKFAHSTSSSSSASDPVHEAEIILCGFLAEHNISFLTMNHLSPLFTRMFPDSNIAKQVSSRRTKSKAIVTNVIAANYNNTKRYQI